MCNILLTLKKDVSKEFLYDSQSVQHEAKHTENLQYCFSCFSAISSSCCPWPYLVQLYLIQWTTCIMCQKPLQIPDLFCSLEKHFGCSLDFFFEVLIIICHKLWAKLSHCAIKAIVWPWYLFYNVEDKLNQNIELCDFLDVHWKC